jgi:hypothetical protein
MSEADRDNRFYRRKEDAEEIDGFRQALIDEKAANQALRADVARLKAPLSSAERRLIDKHCDWVAFGHAWNAVMKGRRALEGK